MPSRIVALSFRYQIEGKVQRIAEGPIVTEVEIETSMGRVISIVPTRSMLELEITVGTEVVSTFMSSDALLEKASHHRLRTRRLAGTNRSELPAHAAIDEAGGIEERIDRDERRIAEMTTDRP